MPDFIASYDLEDSDPSPYASFHKHAIAAGWNETCPMQNGSVTNLPNTTLLGEFQNLEAASAAFEKARLATATAIRGKVTVTRAIIGEIGRAHVINQPAGLLGGLFTLGASRVK